MEKNKKSQKNISGKINASANKKIRRPPVVVIMGHIDHGKSTLLDYIRKTNIVDGESGGITQRISAYEVTNKDSSGVDRRITFLDTPGHEAFKKIRSCGANIADIAILVISAEEGVKEQTLEALKCIRENKMPFIIAINKIDKISANLEKTKQNLLENEIYLEGAGGDIPFIPISAKTGSGVSELLDMMLLIADIEDISGDLEIEASGVVIESGLDNQKGISATLIIKNGTLENGMFIVSEDNIAPIRIMENFRGEKINKASFSSPVRVFGFNKIPDAGLPFSSFHTKKEAEKALAQTDKKVLYIKNNQDENKLLEIPIILIADVFGAIDAMEYEIKKLKSDSMKIKIINKSVGAISESDIKMAYSGKGALIVGFNTKIDMPAQNLARQLNVEIKIFDVIYKISEWLEKIMKERTPKGEVEEKTGSAKILKIFSKIKDKQVLGGKIFEGEFSLKENVNIIRRGQNIGKGEIINLQQNKINVKQISDGGEFGAQIKARVEISAGDIIEGFIMIKK